MWWKLQSWADLLSFISLYRHCHTSFPQSNTMKPRICNFSRISLICSNFTQRRPSADAAQTARLKFPQHKQLTFSAIKDRHENPAPTGNVQQAAGRLALILTLTALLGREVEWEEF
jgi:hypothetical protein